MYKEYRELSRADAVKALYQDMAARHRARFRSIQVKSQYRIGEWNADYTAFYRSSVCRKFRRKTMSGGPILSNSWSPDYASRCRIVSPIPSRHLSQTDLRPSRLLLGSIACAGVARGWGVRAPSATYDMHWSPSYKVLCFPNV